MYNTIKNIKNAITIIDEARPTLPKYNNTYYSYYALSFFLPTDNDSLEKLFEFEAFCVLYDQMSYRICDDYTPDTLRKYIKTHHGNNFHVTFKYLKHESAQIIQKQLEQINITSTIHKEKVDFYFNLKDNS